MHFYYFITLQSLKSISQATKKAFPLQAILGKRENTKELYSG